MIPPTDTPQLTAFSKLSHLTSIHACVARQREGESDLGNTKKTTKRLGIMQNTFKARIVSAPEIIPHTVVKTQQDFKTRTFLSQNSTTMKIHVNPFQTLHLQSLAMVRPFPISDVLAQIGSGCFLFSLWQGQNCHVQPASKL